MVTQSKAYINCTYLPSFDILTHKCLINHGKLWRIVIDIQNFYQDRNTASLMRVI